MSSKSLDDLNEFTAGAAIVHKQCCKAVGVDLLIYCTLRDNKEQESLYALGRAVPGKIVTNARPGQSAHNPDENGQSSAYDCCPMIGGKPVWGTTDPEDAKLWSIVGKCGEEAGLVWSGRWTGSLREMEHFQDPKWRKP